MIAGGGLSWRDSIRIWAESYGVQHKSWRSDLINIAYALGATRISDYREALRFIANNIGDPVLWDDVKIWNDELIWLDFIMA